MLCTALVCTQGVWSFPRAVWVAVLIGKAVSGGCCHQKQNLSVCHATISTQPTVLRLYLHVYPLKGVSGILHCWFPKGRRKNPAWSRLFEGFKAPWRNVALNRRRQVQLIPGKLRAYRGWVGHGGGKEGFLARTQGQAAGDLQSCSICPDFLDVEQPLWCAEGGGRRGRLNTNPLRNENCSKESLLFSCWICRNLQHCPWFLCVPHRDTDAFFFQKQALESVAGWCGCQSSATWALLVRSEKHGWCFRHFQSKQQQQSLQFWDRQLHLKMLQS